jgi:hypothetical protein
MVTDSNIPFPSTKAHESIANVPNGEMSSRKILREWALELDVCQFVSYVTDRTIGRDLLPVDTESVGGRPFVNKARAEYSCLHRSVNTYGVKYFLEALHSLGIVFE